jgi:hypothetical protein
MERAEAGIRTHSAEGHPHDPIKLQIRGLFPTASPELLSRKEKGPSMGHKEAVKFIPAGLQRHDPLNCRLANCSPIANGLHSLANLLGLSPKADEPCL